MTEPDDTPTAPRAPEPPARGGGGRSTTNPEAPPPQPDPGTRSGDAPQSRATEPDQPQPDDPTTKTEDVPQPPPGDPKAAAARRRAELDRIFGDVLPDTTGDERGEARGDRGRGGDDWYLSNRPPHHGG